MKIQTPKDDFGCRAELECLKFKEGERWQITLENHYPNGEWSTCSIVINERQAKKLIKALS